MTQWQPNSWRAKTALQQPDYADQAYLQRSEGQLSTLPPLVFAAEIRQLQTQLAAAAAGKAFLLQGGDCAESFADFSAQGISELFKVFMQMAVVLTYAGKKPVIKLGRLAGQFAKPRSQVSECRDGIELPVFRGDMINGLAFDAAARAADPDRMLQAYHQSTATLNLVRAFASGGLGDLHQVKQWLVNFVDGNAAYDQYRLLAQQIEDALDFMNACGIDTHTVSALRETTLYTSHEALLLNYQQALCRFEECRFEEPSFDESQYDGQWFDCSAHLLWIGERTRQLDGAHVEYLRGVANPIGVKISQRISPDELMALVDKLNPDNIPGRLSLISRMGADGVELGLAPLAKRIAAEGRSVLWVCDPMHGNTITASGGVKTRRFEQISLEIQRFFDVLPACGQYPGGLHLEMTGDAVTECVGGAYPVLEEDLQKRYLSQCDPRLNAQQVLELSFIVAQLMRT